MTESPRQLLRRKAQEYMKQEQVLKAILDNAQLTEGGYVIPTELIEKLKALLAA
jgi:hypothetical protein